MRLSELLGSEALDKHGQRVGRVGDVRMERRDDKWVVVELLIGPGGIPDRLGFVHGGVDRPVLVARFMRRLARRARLAPWDKVAPEGNRVTIDAAAEDLSRPETSS